MMIVSGRTCLYGAGDMVALTIRVCTLSILLVPAVLTIRTASLASLHTELQSSGYQVSVVL